MRLPGLIGQICAGIFIGPYFLNLFKPEAYAVFQPITEFALSLFGLILGTHLVFRKLHNAGKRIFFIVICEIIIVPSTIFCSLYFLLDIPIPQALLLAAIGLTTSPSSIIQIVRENRSRGMFTKTLVTSVALNNIASLILFSITLKVCLSLVDQSVTLAPATVLLAPLKEILGALIIGSSLALLLSFLTKRRTALSYYFTLLILLILLIEGLSRFFQIPGFLSSMVFGFFICNYSSKKHILMKSITTLEPVVFVLFFVIAGMHFDFKLIQAAGMAGVVFIIARSVGKYIAPSLGAILAQSTRNMNQNIGIAFFPQAGISIGFVLIVKSFAEFTLFADYITTIVLGAVIVFELIGPLFTDMAIEMSGEKNKDQSRLLNFLQEEYIQVGLEATDKWEALKELAQFMHRVHGIREITCDELIKSIIDREKTMSTGIGEGVAVPHAIIEGEPQIRGVIGVSHKGINYNAIDDKPVYLIILIATPQGYHDLHLNVLASIARIFGHDPETKNRIFKAKTPAQVHEILQTGNPDAFNIYLEE